MSRHNPVASFDGWRPSLTRLAYRMLGSVADAEDVVQETFLRWLDVDHAAVREPGAFLRRIVMRLCLDQLKSARRRREAYVGPWLPDPIVQPSEDPIDDITLPLMLALERLPPPERAAFLLHDVCGLSFAEVAETIGRAPAACRQLASRARSRVRSERPCAALPKERGLQFAEAFFAATRDGDMEALRALLTEDVSVYADGGGRTPTTVQPIIGLDDVLRLHAALARIFAQTMSRLVRYAFISGLPGFVTFEQEHTLQTTALQIDGAKIASIYVVRNPDKLRHLGRPTFH